MPKPQKKNDDARHFVVGISGASGIVYARRLVQCLLADPAHQVHLIVTTHGRRVIQDEIETLGGGRRRAREKPDAQKNRDDLPGLFGLKPAQARRLHEYPNNDIGARPASGTFLFEAMIVCPCSMNTLGMIARGLQPNLVARAAAVALQEGRTLALVPRETPLSLPELRNLTAAAEAGAAVVPAMPGFYHRPETIDDLVEFVVQKIFDRIGVAFPGRNVRWQGSR